MGIDLLNMAVDFSKTEEKSGILDVLQSWGNYLDTQVSSLPIIGPIWHVGKAMMHMAVGNYSGFIDEMKKSGILGGMSQALDFLFGERNEETGELIEGSGGFSISEFFSSAYDKIKSTI